MNMEKGGGKRGCGGFGLLVCSAIVVQLFLVAESSVQMPARRNLGRSNDNRRELESSPSLRLHKLDDHHIVMDNGIVSVTLSTPGGMVTGIQYHGIDNLLEYNKETNRGYWDIVWNRPTHRAYDQLECTSYRVVLHDENQIEVSFTMKWNSSLGETGLPLDVDKRFIMLKGSSGFYTYAKFERHEGWPSMSIDQARVAFKLRKKLFHYMAISNARQGVMPTEYDRITGTALDYKEAVLLTNPSNPIFKEKVDDKYQYSNAIKDNRVHGWVSYDPLVGFWVITPSNEFRIGGPMKQELSSHVGPTSLAMFFSNHYAGTLSVKFEDGEPWQKVFGPTFIYLNSASHHEDPRTLWQDAQQQMRKEIESWPYDFPLLDWYLHADQRGTVTGRLLVSDRYINKETMNGSFAHVGLANPGDVRSWQTENKGYQFWTQADAEGHFSIKNVRAGNYNLFAWVPGIIGDYRYNIQITITAGGTIRLGNLVYEPARVGPTLWEIGIPDRTAAEFYVPDPNPRLVNPVFVDQANKFRQYGLWDRYTDLYPDQDLVYTVGTSNYAKDWFFAHVNRKTNQSYVPTTWTILFDLPYVNRIGSYTLQLALASSSTARLQGRVNDPNRARVDFGTRLIGRDNAIARHGIHGMYSLYSMTIPGYRLVPGRNAIYLTQSMGGSPFSGLMYDYLRLEGPPETS